MIETLKDVKFVDGYAVIDMTALKIEHPDMFRPDGSMHYHLFEARIRPFNFIYVRDDVNSLSFTLQNGPIHEKGVNGCQIDTIIETAKVMLEGLNKQFPCRENSSAITKLDEALHWLGHRKKDRGARGVEGYAKQ